MDIQQIKDFISLEYENEWLEFKVNWINKEELGKYISAISNSAAEHNQDYGYFIWGVNDKTHEIVETSFNPDMEIDNEPLKHYLARNLYPSINFKFEEVLIDNIRVVVLIIPAAQRIITEFNKERYIRIGSSKELFRKYPEREADLWVTLRNGYPTILNTQSKKQNLTFSQLKTYFISKGIQINEANFEDNLSFYVNNTSKFNILAFLMSDQNDITCRVSTFCGLKKSDKQYALNDFGSKCMLISVDQTLNYAEAINIIKVDETNRVVERKDIPLFDLDCFREALLNAYIHNDWVDMNAPMISIFDNRIEILSYGSLPSKQTLSGFFAGKSKPRCLELAEIFLKLRISERSGRGVAKIADKFGKNVFEIKEDYIIVTIPFNYSKNKNEQIVSKKTSKKEQKVETIKNLIINEMRNNPNVTTFELIDITGMKKTTVQKYIKELVEGNVIRRVGSKNGGYWEVLK